MYFMKVIKKKDYVCIQIAELLCNMAMEAENNSLLSDMTAVDKDTLKLALGKHTTAYYGIKCHVFKKMCKVRRTSIHNHCNCICKIVSSVCRNKYICKIVS